MKKRQSGILLHISSLPSVFGIGDLGPEAYRFVDFLHKTQQSYWQILPINPTDRAHKNSPYSSSSAFAGNTLFISPEFLHKEGYVREDILHSKLKFPKKKVNYEKVRAYKQCLFEEAYARFKENPSMAQGWEGFLTEHAFWVDAYALFVVMKEYFGGKVWTDWPEDLKYRNPEALEAFSVEFEDQLNKVKFLQYVFLKQWRALKDYAHQNGIGFIGDIPIYVTFDSVDVWMQPQYFKLDKDLNPFVVAGVPPDYFSETGQRWGNPVYNWEKLKESGYNWWIKRVEVNLELFDVLRIDHFRGMVNYWEIPAEEETAINGYWVDVPTEDFFSTLKFGVTQGGEGLPIIAEDLGVITDEVRDEMKTQGFPGMKILLFAFGDDDRNPYLPHNYTEDCVVYTGTHDNNTARGWFQDEAGINEKQRLFLYLQREVSFKEIHWALIELAMKSSACLAIIPLQDVLGLDGKARMNKPATIKGNWQWRFLPKALTGEVVSKLRSLTQDSQRD